MSEKEKIITKDPFEEFDKKVEELNKLMFEKLQGLFGVTEKPLTLDEQKQLKRLKSFDLNGVCKYLKTCKNIVFINGAGISTSAGIPDFRSPNTGLYAQLENLGLPPDVRPEDIFNVNYFKKYPEPFYTRMKWFFPLVNKLPSKSHYFQTLMTKKGIVKKIYTQNIDCLESKAGIPNDKLVQGHGSVKTGYCMSCNSKYTLEWMKTIIEQTGFMKCESCEDGLVRPDIVMFGEKMPDAFFQYETDLNECDCLIVTGTSLQVYPFSCVPNAVPNYCPRILINRDRVGQWDKSEEEEKSNYRDVALTGDCDEIYLKLADSLGFTKELNKLIVTSQQSQTQTPPLNSTKKKK